MSYLIETSIPKLYANWNIDQLVGPDNIDEIKQKVNQYLNDGNLEKDGNNLYLYSLENGTGKTSLAYFILGELHKPRLKTSINEFGIVKGFFPTVGITPIVSVKFAEYLRICLDTFTEDSKEVRKQVMTAPVLLLDDVSPWANTDNPARDKKELILLMMYRREHLLPTIVTSNLVPEKFEEQYGATATSKVLENFSYIKLIGGDVRAALYPGIFEESK